jgi:drug/metabolite transporter (DMT)-like permease
METYGDENLTVATAALAAAALAWIPVVWAYLRYLREADELMRMIHVQAMAVAFSVGFCFVLLDAFLVRIASLMPESPMAVKLLSVANPLLMAFAFSFTIFVLQRRYSR